MITGCLSDDTRLEYRVEFPFGDDLLLDITSDASVKLPFERDLQDTFEVSITPVIPGLNFLGMSLSTNLTEGKLVCLPIASIHV